MRTLFQETKSLRLHNELHIWKHDRKENYTIDRISERPGELGKHRTLADDKLIFFTTTKKNYINHIR